MNRPKDLLNNNSLSKQVASAAARYMAEDGIGDYNVAKRKAAHQIGLSDKTQLPDNSEVDDALRAYQSLFQDEEQIERIAYLRQKAHELMSFLVKFNPYLTGSVLEGTAGRYAEIDIQLFTDSTKDVEIFLLNHKIEYEHSVPRSERAEAVLSVHRDDAFATWLFIRHMKSGLFSGLAAARCVDVFA